MACIEDDSPCRSRRCAQRGVCNCSLIYSDGATVPGSGRANDPYVIERPPITCIREADGTQIIPDANRCVKLPAYAKAVVSAENGDIYMPDADGMVTLPTTSLSNFQLLDFDNNVINVATGDNIQFHPDGTFGTVENDYPLIDSANKRIRFPIMKSWEKQIYTSVIPASGNALVTLNHNARLFKAFKTLVWDCSINIYEDTYVATPGSAQYLSLQLQTDEAHLGTGFVTKKNFQWTRYGGHSHHSYHFQHRTDINGNTIANYATRIRVDSTFGFTPSNNFVVDFNVIATWV